jgi:DNA-binding SARP family transcriptional activator
MDEGLRLTLLGKPQISRNGTPITGFIYNKGLALLAYLAVTRRPHSRDALAGLFWGEMTDAAARANLRKVLSALREVAGPELTIDRQTVAFAPTGADWLDIEAFEAKVDGVVTGSKGMALPTASQVPQFEEAVALYRGDFLEGFYVRNAPEFEEWVLSEREHLRQIAVHAFFNLVGHHTAGGDYGRGLSYATRLLALEPWHEEVHQQMMILLALSGQRSAALNQFEICRRLLAEELGAEPSGDTVDLHRRIAKGEVVPPSSPTWLAVDWPVDVTPFVGRTEELAKLVGYLVGPDSHMATVVGISGVGKTRMVLQVAAATQEAFGRAVHYVSAPAAASTEALALAILRALALPLAGQRNAASQLIAHLRERKLLIVLDQLCLYPGVADFLRDLIHEARKVRLLVACSNRLNVPGEWVLPLYGLKVPETDNLEHLRASDAMRLFIQAVERACGACVIEDEQLLHIARICRLVDGLPLAIELAAGWARLLPYQDIAAEIENNYRFLVASVPAAHERHHSLTVAFGYSWDLMPEVERSLLRQLSVFRGSFAREAAQEVAGASLPALAALMDRCLIQRTLGGRYRIHGLLAQFGREKLADQPEEEAQTYERYCGYFTRFLQRAMVDLDAASGTDPLALIAAEHADLDASWKWAVAYSDPAPAASPAQRTTAERFRAAMRSLDGHRMAEAASGG